MLIMKRKKGPAYYARVLASSFLALVLFSAYYHFFREDAFLETFARLWTLPFVITLIFLFYNVLKDKLFSGVEQASEEREFILHMSRHVRNKLDFNAEDFARIRESGSFQDLLRDAYALYRDAGRSEEGIERLKGRSFGDEDLDRAAGVVIEETSRLIQKKAEMQ